MPTGADLLAPQADGIRAHYFTAVFPPVVTHFFALLDVAHLDLFEPRLSPREQQPDRLGICRGRHQAEDREQEESFHSVSLARPRSDQRLFLEGQLSR